LISFLLGGDEVAQTIPAREERLFCPGAESHALAHFEEDRRRVPIEVARQTVREMLRDGPPTVPWLFAKEKVPRGRDPTGMNPLT
jgi:hypothetical protein